MQVVGNRLHLENAPTQYFASPNKGPALGTPRVIVLHYTAGASLQGAVRWLTNAESGASAHLVVDDTEVVQLVPFDQRAWHAGVSRWTVPEDPRGMTYQGLNQVSIGIEMVNPGRLVKRGDGNYYTRGGRRVDPENVVVATHQFETRESGWHAYSSEQFFLVLAVCRALIRAWPSIKYVVGHDEVAIPTGRKVDPGPAWDMDAFRSRLFGRNG